MGQSELAAQAGVRGEPEKQPHGILVCPFSHLSAPLREVSGSGTVELTASVGAMDPEAEHRPSSSRLSQETN